MAAFGIGMLTVVTIIGDENVSLADYYTHIELIKELIASYEKVMSLLIWKILISPLRRNNTIQAVKDVSIQIEKGDIYGIVGYSECGKSTLVRAINLLQVPTILVVKSLSVKMWLLQEAGQLSTKELRQTSNDWDDFPTL